MDAPNAVTSLPEWMQKFAFWGSLSLVLIKIFEISIQAFRKSSLNIVLTREVFIRLLNSGECIYTNAVLVSNETGALITSISAELFKKGTASKLYEMQISQIGEKYRDNSGEMKFSFHSTSPLAFVLETKPVHQSYICQHENYAERAIAIYSQFEKDIFDKKQSLGDISTLEADAIEQLFKDMKNISDTAASNIMETVQIEGGDYSLKIEVKYKQKGKFIPITSERRASSSIEFKVQGWVRDFLRSKLQESLFLRVNHVFGVNLTNQYVSPEYNPIEVKELVGNL